MPTAIQPTESVPMEIQTTIQAAISEDTRQKSFADTTQLNNFKEDPNEIIILNEIRTRPPPPFQCSICFTFFSDPENLNRHIESVHEKPMTRNVFESHVASVHEKKKLFVENGQLKGQLISECPFNLLNFPKNQGKNLTNFCPRI